jgi:hypothetical protein
MNAPLKKISTYLGLKENTSIAYRSNSAFIVAS